MKVLMEYEFSSRVVLGSEIAGFYPQLKNLLKWRIPHHVKQ